MNDRDMGEEQERDGSSVVGDDSRDERDLLDRIAEEYLERRRRGERPDRSEYVNRYPEQADALDDLLTAVEHLEELTAVAPSLGRQPSITGLGPYRITREIGRGGMAVVYEAEDTLLGRRVALKVLPDYATSDQRFRTRFLREVQAAASLDHPNIVPVYGAGEVDGVHFYAMQLIDGVGVDELLDEIRLRRTGGSDGRRPEPEPATALHELLVEGAERREVYYRAVARMGMEIADALEHAHCRGILHRDLKPSNVLVDIEGRAWVTDFGLCKSETAGDLTVSGDLVGTLRYMAPERLSGSGDVRSDVYGLGLVLYELLALQPAVRGRERPELIREVIEDMPPAPRKVESGIPRDLETIVLRATSKLPEARYPTAATLARDLRAFLEERPIVARRPTPWYLLWLMARRNKVVTGTIAGAVALLVIATAVYISSTHELLRQRDDSLVRTRGIGLSSAATGALQTDPMLSLLLARRAVRLHPGAEAWSTLQRALTAVSEVAVIQHGRPVTWARYAPDGSIVTLSGDRLSRFESNGVERRVIVGADSSGTEPSNGDAVAFRYARVDRTGRYWLALDLLGRVHVFVEDGARLAMFGGDVSVVEFQDSPGHDGQSTIYVGTVGGDVRQHALDGEEIRRVGTLPAKVNRLRVAQSGHIVAATRDAHIVVWHPDGSQRASFESKTEQVRVIEIGPGETGVAIGGHEHIRRYSLDGVELAEYRGHEDFVLSIDFSNDGRHMVTGSSDQTAHVWDLTSGERRVLTGHGTSVNEVLFTPDGKGVLTASSDQTAILWDLRGRLIQVFRGHNGPVVDVQCSADGRRVLTASSDGTVRVWELQSSQTPVLRGHSRGLYTAEYSPDGSSILTASRDETSRLWRLDGTEVMRIQFEQFPCFSEFSPDGRSVLTATAYSAFLRHSVAGEFESKFASEGGRVLAAWCRDETMRLVCRTAGNDAHVFVDGTLVAALRGHTDTVWGASFDQAGARILTGSNDGTARLFDLDGTCRQTFEGHTARVRTVYFDRHERLVVTASDDATARVWSLDGRQISVLRGHGGPVLMAVFSPTDSRVLTASRDHTARLWSADGEPELDLIGHTGVVWSARFSPDGRRVVTSSFDYTARVWIVSEEDLLAAADLRATRQLSPQERRRFRDLLDPDRAHSSTLPSR